jgi:hypothetical protein
MEQSREGKGIIPVYYRSEDTVIFYHFVIGHQYK